MFDRFTDRARKVMNLAKSEAQRLNHEYIGTEHVLLGLVQEGSGVAANVLRNMGIDLKRIRSEIEKLVKGSATTVPMGNLPFTPRAKKVLELSLEEASQLGHNYIGTEHLLLGLIKESEGIAARVLTNLGIKLEDVREEVLEFLGAPGGGEEVEEEGGGGEPGEPQAGGGGGGAGGQPRGKGKTPALNAFGRDLTKLARDKALDPVIGRRGEIERVIQILSRRTKNNPVLLGEAGVGKTAIVEGLAQDIINEEVPEILKGKRLVVLDLAMMVAGTKYRGQFEERIKSAENEAGGDTLIILFIDELHTLVGAGGAEGAIDASNVLKPALSRGEIQCIGATTLTEYRKYIEKDPALERRFQSVIVEPPTPEHTFEILKGLRERYEKHHNVKITDGALQLAVDLSTRYITNRFHPDKAIDVMDEAGARVRLKAMTAPPDLKELEVEIHKLDKEKEECVAQQDFERAASLRDRADKLRAKRDEIESEWKSNKGEIDGTVDEDVIAETISKMTNIPLQRMDRGEAVRLLEMEKVLHETVISQDDAITAISRAVRRSRSGLKDPRRPMGSFLFLGPTGVGKTHLAKQLAKFLFGDEEALIQIDMSEYMEKHNASRLVGAPPGYVGYEEGGQLTEKIRRRPYAVVLFDEIEKGHADVYNMLLQIMEEGRLTDSFGRAVDFRNVLLIMTSNIGANIIKNQTGLGFASRDPDKNFENMKHNLMNEVNRFFRPEFLNRLDDVIVFQPLREEDLVHILDIELLGIRARLQERDLELELTESAQQFLIKNGTNLEMGARPLRRAVERYLEDDLSEELLKGDFEGADKVLVDALEEAEKLDFTAIKAAEEVAASEG